MIDPFTMDRLMKHFEEILTQVREIKQQIDGIGRVVDDIVRRRNQPRCETSDESVQTTVQQTDENQANATTSQKH